MMRSLAMLCVLLPLNLAADSLWLQAAGSSGSATGSRFGASRTLDAFGLKGASVGVTHSRVEDSWWTVLDAGLSHRWSDSLIVSGKAEVGPGQFDGGNSSYRKLNVAAMWLVSERWSLDVSESYINVDATIGHVLGASLTRYVGDYHFSLHAVGSVGSAIDNSQLGASFRRNGRYPVFGGVYAGETSDPATLRQLGDSANASGVKLRQAYAGISVPLGEYTLMAVADFLRADDARRQELSLVLTIPLGNRGAGQ